ncbi:unnamed protein product, partial [Meganyctiphanes norvegica]
RSVRMERLHLVLLVLVGQQALAYPNKKQQHSIIESVPRENLKALPNPGVTTSNTEATKGNPGVTTGTSGNTTHLWIIEPRLMNAASPQVLDDKKMKQLNIFPNSVAVKKLNDQVDTDGKGISGKMRQSCGGEFTTSSGVISHPLNGGNYGDNEACSWIIRTSNPIRISFTSFNVEQNWDFLKIRDGESAGAAIIGELTGDSIPSPVQTTTNAAYLSFTSDGSNTGTGFELSWEPVSAVCGQANHRTRIVGGEETE